MQCSRTVKRFPEFQSSSKNESHFPHFPFSTVLQGPQLLIHTFCKAACNHQVICHNLVVRKPRPQTTSCEGVACTSNPPRPHGPPCAPISTARTTSYDNDDPISTLAILCSSLRSKHGQQTSSVRTQLATATILYILSKSHDQEIMPIQQIQVA